MLIFDTFSLIYLDSPNLIANNNFFFFFNGSWWDFRLISLFLFSVCCGSNNKFSSIFIEPFNITLIFLTFFLTVCNTSASSSRKMLDFAHHLIAPCRLVQSISKILLSSVVSTTHVLFQRVINVTLIKSSMAFFIFHSLLVWSVV